MVQSLHNSVREMGRQMTEMNEVFTKKIQRSEDKNSSLEQRVNFLEQKIKKVSLTRVGLIYLVQAKGQAARNALPDPHAAQHSSL